MGVYDRWMKPAKDAQGRPVYDNKGKPAMERTTKYGVGRRWAATYRDPAGRQKSPTFRTKVEAEKHWAEVTGAKNRGTYLDHKAGRTKLRALIQESLELTTSDLSTRYQLASRYNTHIIPRLGDHEIRGIDEVVVRKWMRDLQDDPSLSNNYVRQLAGLLSALLSVAVEKGMLQQNPFRLTSVKLPTKDDRKIVAWTTGQTEAMRAALSPRYREIVSVGSGLGLRQGEIFGLSPDDVDYTLGSVHVRRQVKRVRGSLFWDLPKRGKTRTVPLPASLAQRLKAHSLEHPPLSVSLPLEAPGGKPSEVPLLFTTGVGTAIGAAVFSRSHWHPALETAGISRSRENGMHALRHRFASVVLANGATVRDLAAWLGHEDPGFTLRVYSHMLPDSAEKMRAAIDSVFGGPGSEGVSQL